MFGGFPPDLLDDMAAEPISAHVHKWSVTSDVGPVKIFTHIFNFSILEGREPWPRKAAQKHGCRNTFRENLK